MFLVYIYIYIYIYICIYVYIEREREREGDPSSIFSHHGLAWLAPSVSIGAFGLSCSVHGDVLPPKKPSVDESIEGLTFL